MMSTVSEKLLQVAQNNPKVYHSGQLNIVKNAECLKEFKSDTSLLLDNVSPVKHNMGVKVHGKNLFNLSNWVSDYKVTHEVLDNGQILITGASETTKSGYTQFKQFLNAGTYTVSATMTANSTGTHQMVNVWQVKDSQTIKTLYNSDGTTGLQRTVTITLTESKYYYFGLYGGTDNDESVYVTIQIEYGSTATEYEPYNNDIQNIYSKNLIPYPYVETTKTVNGVTFTDNGDGTITVNGTATADINYVFCKSSVEGHYVNLIAGYTYTLSGCPSGGSSGKYFLRTEGTQNYTDYGGSVTFTAPSDYTTAGMVIYIANGVTVENLVFKPQLEYGKTATAYAKYHEPYPLVVSRYGKNLFNQYAESKFINPYRGIVVSDFCNNANSAMYTLSVSLKQGATFQEGINFGLVRMNKFNGSSAQWFQTKTDTNFRSTYTIMNSLDHIPDFYVALVGIYPSTEDNWNRIINNYNIQIEYGKLPTDYEPYKECADYTPNADGTVEGVTSLCPNTTLLTNDPYGKVYIDCEYYKDVDKAFDELTTSVALSGGDS